MKDLPRTGLAKKSPRFKRIAGRARVTKSAEEWGGSTDQIFRGLFSR